VSVRCMRIDPPPFDSHSQEDFAQMCQPADPNADFPEGNAPDLNDPVPDPGDDGNDDPGNDDPASKDDDDNEDPKEEHPNLAQAITLLADSVSHCKAAKTRV